MPEGPEIHRASDRIRTALEGKKIFNVKIDFQPLAGMEYLFEGEVIEKVEARGKALLIHGPTRVLYAHSQLYGRWMVNSKSRTLPKSNRSLRILFESDTHVVRLFSATDILLLEHHEIELHPYISKLGPDVVLPSTGVMEIQHHITQQRFQRRRLGGLLLDQGFLSGIGNYLRSEILYKANLLPQRTIASLKQEELLRFCEVTKEIVQRAYEHKGITLSQERYTALRNQGLTHGASRHYVFTRAGRTCYECQTLIERHNVSSRRLDLCPSCQV